MTIVPVHDESAFLSNMALALESPLIVKDVFTATAPSEAFASSPVPADKLWLITFYSISLVNRAPSRLIYRLVHAGDWVILADELRTLLANRFFTLTLNLYLPAGDYLTPELEGMQVGDTVYLTYGGYQMAVA